MLTQTPASPSRSRSRSRSYDDMPMTREDCVSVIECNPHHIRFLPKRLLDNGLMVLALRLGAKPDEIRGALPDNY